MQINNYIIENRFVEMLCNNFKRSTLQINKLNESDAEIISIPGTSVKLAITTDNISEEIEKGLYNNPYQIGWMSVIINASDIAAVGADPLGILLNETFSEKYSDDIISEIQKGISDACDYSGFFVLGGDTNYSSSPQFGAVAIGLISDDKIISRKGCNENDMLYLSGQAGRGNAYAFSKLFKTGIDINYLPVSRIKQGKIIRRYASCCMDTSDGVMSALDQLMRINQKGFIVDAKPEYYIDNESYKLSEKINKSSLIMLAGQHGEFELIFTIPEHKNYDFLNEAKSIGWNPFNIGKVQNEINLSLSTGNSMYKPDSAKIRNLLSETNGNIEKYINELFKIFNF